MPSPYSIGKISVDTAIDFSGYRKDRAALLADLNKLADDAARSMSRALSNGLADGIKVSRFGYALRQEIATGTAGLDTTFQRNLARGISGLGKQVRSEIDSGLTGIAIKPSIQMPNTSGISNGISGALQQGIQQADLGNTIVSSILKANIATSLATGLVGGIGGAIGGSVNALRGIASTILGDITGGIRQTITENNLTEQVKRGMSAEQEAIGGASAIQAKGGLTFEQGRATFESTRRELAKLAATLPGTTEQYLSIYAGIQDELVESFRGIDRKLDPTELKNFQKNAIEISKDAGILSGAAGLNPNFARMGLSRALNGTSSFAQLRQLQYFQDQPQIVDEMVRLAKLKNANELSELDAQSRALVVQQAQAKFVTPERVEAAKASLDSTFQGAKDSLFGMQGSLSIQRDLGGGDNVYKSVSAAVKSLIGEGGFLSELGTQATAVGLNVGDPMVALKNTIDSINGALKEATAGLQTFFQTDFGKGLIDVFNQVQSAIGGIPKLLSDAFNFIAPIAAQAFQTLAPVFSAIAPLIGGVFENAKGTIVQVGGVLQEVLLQAQPIVAEFVANVMPKVVEFFQSLSPLLKNAWDFILDIGKAATEAFLGAMANPAVQTAINTIFSALSSVAGTLGEVFGWLSQQNQLWDTIGGLLSSVISVAIVAIANTADLIGKAIGVIWGILQLILPFIVLSVTMTAKWLTIIANGIVGALNLIRTIWDKITQFLNETVGKSELFKASLNIAQGIANKIKQAFFDLLGAIPKITDQLKNMAPPWLKDLMKMINSPSPNQGEVGAGGASSADQFVGAVLSILEAGEGDKQGQVDVAKVIANRVGNNFDNKGKTIRDQAFAPGQFQPFFSVADGGYGIGRDDIKDEESAIAALMKARKMSREAAKQLIDEFFAAVRDPNMVKRSAEAIGSRSYFLGVGMGRENANDVVQRNGQSNFFFNARSDSAGNRYNSIGIDSIFGASGGGSSGGTIVGGGAMRSGLYTGASGDIGAGAEYHIDSKFQRSLGMEKIGQLFDQIAKGYEAEGRFIEFSNAAVSGLTYRLNDPNRLETLKKAIGAHHSQGRDENRGVYSVDYYAPKQGTNRFSDSVKNHEIMLPSVPGTNVVYSQDPGGYGNFARIVDSSGKTIMWTGHGAMSRGLPDNKQGSSESQADALKRLDLAGRGAVSINGKNVDSGSTATTATNKLLSDEEFKALAKKGVSGQLKEELDRLEAGDPILKKRRENDDQNRRLEREKRDAALNARISKLYKSEDQGVREALQNQQKVNQVEDQYADSIRTAEREIEDIKRLQANKKLRIASAIEEGKQSGQPFDPKKATASELKARGISPIDFEAELKQAQARLDERKKLRDVKLEPVRNEIRKQVDAVLKTRRDTEAERLQESGQYGEKSEYRQNAIELAQFDERGRKRESELKSQLSQFEALAKATTDPEQKKQLEQEIPQLQKELAELPENLKKGRELIERNFAERMDIRFSEQMRSIADFSRSEYGFNTAEGEFAKKRAERDARFRETSNKLRDYLRDQKESLNLEGLSAEQRSLITERINEATAAQEKLNEANRAAIVFAELQLKLDREKETAALKKQIAGDQSSGLEAQAKALEKFNPQAAIDLRRRAAGIQVQENVRARVNEVNQQALDRLKMLQTEDGRSVLQSAGLGSADAIEQARQAQLDTLKQTTINDLEEIKSKFPTIAEALRDQTRSAFSDGLKGGIRGFIDGKGFDWQAMLKNIADVFINKGIDMFTNVITNGVFGDGKKNQGLLGGLFGVGKSDPMVDSATMTQGLLEQGGMSAGQRLIEAAIRAKSILDGELPMGGIGSLAESMRPIPTAFGNTIVPAGGALSNLLNPTPGLGMGQEGLIKPIDFSGIGQTLALDFAATTGQVGVGQSFGAGFLQVAQQGLPNIMQSIIGLFQGRGTGSSGGGAAGTFLSLLQTGLGLFAGGKPAIGSTAGASTGKSIAKLLNFASGGEMGSFEGVPTLSAIADGLKREKLLSGRTPILAALHEGERVLTIPQVNYLRSAVIDGLIPNFDKGGVMGIEGQMAQVYETLSPENSISRSHSFTVEYKKVGDADMVSREQADSLLSQLETRVNRRNDPQQGAKMALDFLRSSPSARRQAGF
ncbi:MAG: cell wall hydrolase [Leptolyngbya sp. UWPOB_LEPTO1]|uniref:cell wall hydrolase n=1 Tax=Leptolyngbya sp. UWPOB_LEPTO1 TaxID=2815653 RepID=UPI001AC91F63|nr:cell wall hydrolase [Leptolyngbya sp. UWPOB_LEPTO1]MBN8564523.1 cell wall hydrolase [Leptolyngbya sp. UWPOB_LEPTO1]